METIFHTIFVSLFIVSLIIFVVLTPTLMFVVWFQKQLLKRKVELLELNKPDRVPKWQAKESDSKRS